MVESFMTNGENYIIKVLKSETKWDDSLKDYKQNYLCYMFIALLSL